MFITNYKLRYTDYSTVREMYIIIIVVVHIVPGP